MCDRYSYTEMKDSYKSPKLKKPTTTRSRRYEQFLWQELYNEYIRHNERLMHPKIKKSNTEYYDEFCKDMPPVDEATKDAVINRHPLYSSTAITLWNRSGDITKDFKKRYIITRPTHEQTEQFG